MIHAGEANQESLLQGIKTQFLELGDVPRRPAILNNSIKNKQMLFGNNSQLSSIEAYNGEEKSQQSDRISNGVIAATDNNNYHDLERSVSVSNDEQMLSQAVTIRDGHSINSIFNLTQEDMQEQMPQEMQQPQQLQSQKYQTRNQEVSCVGVADDSSMRMLALIENRIEDKQKKQDKVINQKLAWNTYGKENSNNSISQQQENLSNNNNNNNIIHSKSNNWKRIIANKNQGNCSHNNNNSNASTAITTTLVKPPIQAETSTVLLAGDKQPNLPVNSFQKTTDVDSSNNLNKILAKSRDENKHILDIMRRQEAAMRELASELHSNDQAAASAAQQTIIALENTVSQQKTQIINQQRELTSMILELKGKDETICRYSCEIKQLQGELRQLYGKRPIVVAEKLVQTEKEEQNEIIRSKLAACYSQSSQTIGSISSQINCSTQTYDQSSLKKAATSMDGSSQTLESPTQQKVRMIMGSGGETISGDQNQGMIQEYLLKISDLEMVLSQVQFELSQAKRQNQEFNQASRNSSNGQDVGDKCGPTGREIFVENPKKQKNSSSNRNAADELQQECQAKQQSASQLGEQENSTQQDQQLSSRIIEEPLPQRQRSLSQSSNQSAQQLSCSQSHQSISKKKQSLVDSQHHLYSSQSIGSIDGLYRSVQAGKESASYMSLKEKKQRQQQQQQSSTEKARNTERNTNTSGVVRAFGSDDISECSHIRQVCSTTQSQSNLLPPFAQHRHSNLPSQNSSKQLKSQQQEKQLLSSSKTFLQYSQSSHQLRSINHSNNNRNNNNNTSRDNALNNSETHGMSSQSNSSIIMPMFLNSSSLS